MRRNIPLKTSGDVAGIRNSCHVAVETLLVVGGLIEPRTSTLELDRIAAQCIRDRGAQSALVSGFPASICISVNEVAVHGLPSSYRLQEGDLLSVDITLFYRGWWGDVARTYLVGRGDPDSGRLLRAAQAATAAGVSTVKAGARIGDIGAAIEEVSARYRCTVLEECEGHGLGRELHEEPRIPHRGKRGEGLRIVPGMVFTVEPALSLGTGPLLLDQDGWSLRTSDKARTAHYEQTVAVFKDRTEILTPTDAEGPLESGAAPPRP